MPGHAIAAHRTGLLLVAMVLGLATGGNVQAQTPTTGLSDPREAIGIYLEATAAGNADALAAIYAPNAVLLAPNAPVIGGRDAIRSVFRNNFSLGPNTIEFGQVQYDGNADRALILWTWVSEIKPASGDPIRMNGRSMVYFARSEAGWHITADMLQEAPAPVAQ